MGAPERFLAERSRHGRAAEGLSETTRALREGAVAAPGVTTPTMLERERLWVGAAPHLVGVSKESLAPLDARACWQVPADAAVLRALAGEGGELVAVPEKALPGGEAPLRDGVGAAAGPGSGFPCTTAGFPGARGAGRPGFRS